MYMPLSFITVKDYRAPTLYGNNEAVGFDEKFSNEQLLISNLIYSACGWPHDILTVPQWATHNHVVTSAGLTV